ncbi:DUF6531 domain-containing protein, partial [Snodgrassella alvi]|uniref:DUF6531 domain-containing protein n=1 Tax=Snodgrassella alvi TaxID=1196083 RepID=UPI001C5572F1
MGQAYWAAREGDILLHTSLLADIAGAAVEMACYAAITAAASLAVFGTLATGGLAGFALGVVVGVVMGVSGGSNKISELADRVSGLFPPSEDGKIKTGSPNTRINKQPAARAAGTIDQNQELVGDNAEPKQPKSFVDITAGILGGLWDAAKEMVQPTVASPDPRAVPAEDDKIRCLKHPSSFADVSEKLQQPPSVTDMLCPGLAAADLIMGGISAITGSPEYLAEGSSKVYINSQPAVRSNDRSTCEAKVTDDNAGGVKVSSNVRIGGEPIVVRKIRSGKHPVSLMLSVIMAAMRPGKICTKIGCFATDFLIGAGSSYLTSQATKAIMSGHPVHLPTGAKLFFGTEELDFTLPAHLPLQWQRFYSSVDTRSHNMFGAGWSVSFEVEIEISPQPDGSCAAIYINEQGRRLEIDPLQPGEGMRGINENLTIRRGQHNRWVIEDDDGLYRLFEPDPNQPHRLYLTALQDRNDNRLLLYRDSHSRIIEITDNDRSTCLSLHYQHPRHPQRVTTIKQQLANGHSRVLAQYQYTVQGDLQHVIDAEQRHTRTFAYDTGRRLIYHRLPTGLHCHYQWAHFADAAETAWRVTHHWTEADGQRQEDYHFHYDIEQRLTTVKDSLGRISQHYWNEVY